MERERREELEWQRKSERSPKWKNEVNVKWIASSKSEFKRERTRGERMEEKERKSDGMEARTGIGRWVWKAKEGGSGVRGRRRRARTGKPRAILEWRMTVSSLERPGRSLADHHSS